jgi:Sulfatase-modifying factor enzyme 1
VFFNFFTIFVVLLIFAQFLGTTPNWKKLLSIAGACGLAAFIALALSGAGIAPKLFKDLFIILVMAAALLPATGFVVSRQIATELKLVGLLIAAGIVDLHFTYPPPGKVAYWLVDVVNKALLYVFVGFDRQIAEPAVELLTETLSPFLVYLSAHFPSLHALFVLLNILLAWWMASKVSRRVAGLPPLDEWRLPPVLLIMLLACWLVKPHLQPWQFVSFLILFAYNILWAGNIFVGLVLLLRLARRIKIGRWVGILPFILLVVFVELLTFVGFLGIADGLFGIGRGLPKAPVGGKRMPGYPARIALVLTSVLFTIMFVRVARFNQVLYIGEGLLFDTPREKSIQLEFSKRSDEIVIEAKGGKSFAIDIYEYPNRHGEMPEVELNFESAVELCRAKGKRLCTMAEWELACTAGEPRRYIWGADPTTISEKCNYSIRTEGKLLPVGSMRQCASEPGVFDLPGNAWEWLGDELPFGFRVIAGGAYNIWDDFSCGCRGFLLVRENQIPISDTRGFGLRCCRDAGN